MMLLTQFPRKLSNKVFTKPKAKLLLILLLISSIGFSQENRDTLTVAKKKRYTYTKFEFAIPIRVNQYAGEIDEYGEDEPWFLPDGVIGRFGMGIKINQFLWVGGNIGIDWKANECLVVAPLFGTIKINSKVSKDFRMYVEPGFGRAMAIGRNDLSGYFKKISLGFEDANGGLGLYLELCQYGFSKNSEKRIGSFCIGLAYTMN
ncbi:hypothetical protein WMW71_02980 [Flavobacterium buctense]|uniref:Outer membrane protein beta-barrel domain-containing protein n=1 Tax=Flavobacterium buctense TaxID=1648146 RepID=A0ABU9DY31_9FLAO|nr:hypothetical protein [Flavobacterium buctense]